MGDGGRHRSAEQVVRSSTGGVKFGFGLTKKSFVTEKGSDGQLAPLVTLHEYLQKTKATSIVKHEAFSNHPPTEVSPNSALEFVPTSSDLKELLTAALRHEDLVVSWQVKVKDQQVLPMGIVVHNKKQLIMPAAGSVQLK